MKTLPPTTRLRALALSPAIAEPKPDVQIAEMFMNSAPGGRWPIMNSVRPPNQTAMHLRSMRQLCAQEVIVTWYYGDSQSYAKNPTPDTDSLAPAPLF